MKTKKKAKKPALRSPFTVRKTRAIEAREEVRRDIGILRSMGRRHLVLAAKCPSRRLKAIHEDAALAMGSAITYLRAAWGVDHE